MKKLFAFIALFITVHCSAQSFYKFTSPAKIQTSISAIPTYDGGFITSNMVKFDGIGNTQWSKYYLYLQSTRICQAYDSSYAYTGSTNSYGVGTPSPIFVRTSKNGSFLGAKAYISSNATIGVSIKQTVDSGYIIAVNDSNNIILIKTNKLGDTTWVKKYTTTNGINATDIITTKDTGYVITGVSKSATQRKTLLYKVNSTGNTVWAKDLSSSTTNENESGVHLAVSTGGYILTSQIEDRIASIYKLDTNGTVVSVNLISTAGSVFRTQSIYSIGTNDGGTATVGSVFPNPADTINSLLFAVKTNAAGTVNWCKAYGNANTSLILSCIKQNSNSSYSLLGHTKLPTSEDGIVFINTDSNGKLNCQDTLFATSSGSTTPNLSNINITTSNHTLTVHNFAPTDTAGTISKIICFPVSVNNKNEILTSTIYPNPNNGSFTIKVVTNHSATSGIIEISNIQGQILQRKQLIIHNGVAEYETKEVLCPGTYYLSIQAGNERSVKIFTVQ
ncbi:hypothetical protein CAP35_06860 [Chitinophagaceae bacterium IBVUCB1]|nr:hypothetical protein CAP35_06860 [Chitinophagaceae bacterium IBVUCB1]